MKIEKRLISCMLTILLFFCCMSSTIANFIGFASGTTTTPEYFSSGLLLESLHNQTNRSSKSNATPEITVFTYGCGGELFHWCNDGESDAFNYDEDSMVTALQKRLGNCKLFKVSFDAGQDKNVDTKSKKD